MKTAPLVALSALALALVGCAPSSVTDGQAIAAPMPGGSVDMQAYPAALPGQKRLVITLPAQPDEGLLKVELIVGQTLRIDCNNHKFGGRLEERTAQGWGYNFYVLDSLGMRASTMKACPPGSERQAFVRSSHETLVRYNSRLPLVVYVPADTELRYRIWRAEADRLVE